MNHLVHSVTVERGDGRLGFPSLTTVCRLRSRPSAALRSLSVEPQVTERERLRARVADHCVEHGVSDLTLRGVAQAVGSNNRMLLYYFGSKEGLISEALAEAMSRFPQLQGTFDALEAPERALQDRLLSAWRAISAEPNLPYLRLFFEVFGLAVHRPARFADVLTSVGNEWSQRVALTLRGEGVPAAEARVMARELVALWRGLQFDLLATGDRRNIERTYQAAVRDLVQRVDAFTEASTTR